MRPYKRIAIIFLAVAEYLCGIFAGVVVSLSLFSGSPRHGESITCHPRPNAAAGSSAIWRTVAISQFFLYQ
jgi:hypothetical protein